MSDSKRDPGPVSSERRGGERHIACFPAYVERTEGAPYTAMIHDLSATGALLLMRKARTPDEVLKLKLFILEDLDQSRVASGRVVRCEPLPEEEVGLWTHRVAVQFDEPLTMYEKEIRSLKERQARLGPLK